MSNKNKKLTDFGDGNSKKSIDNSPNGKKSENIDESQKNNEDKTGNDSDGSTVCSCYHEMKIEHQDTIDELGITPPKCGHCIAYLSNEVSAGSASNYNSSLRFFIESIHQQGICIDDIEFTDVRGHFETRGKQRLSKSTIAIDKSAIKGVISRYEAENKKFPELSWKISENIDPSNYSTGSKFERTPLKNEEINKLISESDDFRNKLMVVTSIETGPRAKAITLIKISDVNLEKKEIELKNTKSGGTYVIPLTDNLAALLKHWIQNIRISYIVEGDSSYLFPSRKGGKMLVANYRTIVNTAAKEAGIQEEIGKIPLTGKQKNFWNTDKDYRVKWKVDVHTLRHTFSRLLKNNDVSKEARIYALDHSRDVTDGYGIDEEACKKEIKNKFDGIDIDTM